MSARRWVDNSLSALNLGYYYRSISCNNNFMYSPGISPRLYQSKFKPSVPSRHYTPVFYTSPFFPLPLSSLLPPVLSPSLKLSPIYQKPWVRPSSGQLPLFPSHQDYTKKVTSAALSRRSPLSIGTSLLFSPRICTAVVKSVISCAERSPKSEKVNISQ